MSAAHPLVSLPTHATPGADEPRPPARLAVGAALAAIGVGTTALAGWAADTRAPLSWGAGPTIKAGTALAVVLCAVALLLVRRSSPGRAERTLSRALCSAVGLWALVVVAEWVLGRSLGIDQVLVHDESAAGVAGRPSPHAAISLTLLAAAIGTVDLAGRQGRRLHLTLLALAGTVVALAAVGWLFSAPVLTGRSAVSGLALPTLAALVSLVVALGTVRPERPPGAWATGSGPATTLLRRLGPAAIAVPVLVGALRVAGEQAGLWDQRFGVSLSATAMMAVFLLLVVTTAQTVERHDLDRRAGERSLAASEAELRTLQLRLQAVLDHMPGAVFLQDLDGRLQTVNRACAEALGAAPDELLGRPATDFPGHDLLAGPREHEDRVSDRREVVVFEASGEVGGATRHQMVTKYPVEDEQGRLIGIGGVTLDITDRKLAEQALRDAERRMRQLFEAAPDALIIADGDGIVRDVNGQAERLFDYAREDLVGRPVELLIPAAARGTHAAHRSGYAVGPKIRPMGAGAELRARRRDGGEVPVEVSLSPLHTDDGLLVAAAVRDVTARALDAAEQAALRRVATTVAQEVGAPVVFQLVAEEAAVVLGAGTGLVARFEGSTGTVLGSWTRAGAGSAPQAGESVDLAQDDGGPPRLVLRDGVTAPVRVGGRLWGAVGVAGARGAGLPADAAARVERFADLVSIAISNAQAWETLARHAAIDAVTGLPNHRTFHARLREECERARRHGRPLSVVLFDLDDFKRVNDTHGHHTGDRVLAEAARRLGEQARQGELVARVGGEEFAWLQPETSAMGAFAAAERARRAIEAEPFAGVGRVTISAGVCSLEDSGDPDSLLQHADRALYWAKDAGRNATFRYTDAAHDALADRTAVAVPRRQTMSSVRALARAIDAKDVSTHSHSERVANLAELLALRLGWTTKRARQLHSAALLHDVGKIGIADSILLKPGPLTDTEYAEIKRHAEIGASIVAEVLDEEPTRWVRHHHERWDAGGYPDQLGGDAIPDGAQILALADAWDVMTTSRAYRQALTYADARAECRRQRGRQFAPEVVDALASLGADELDSLRDALAS